MKILKYIFLFGVLCVNSAALAQKITKVVDKEVSFIAITAESFDGRQASVNSGVSSLMKKVSFEYDINLPVDTIIPWLQDLDNKGHELIEEKKELKRAEKKKQKLFK